MIGWCGIGYNRDTKTITVNSYDEINIVGFMDVDLVAGKEGSITIASPSNILPFIKVESQNNTLQIYYDPWRFAGFNFQFGNNNRTLVTVPFESLNRIKLTGSGKVVSNNPIVSDSLIADLNGSGDMTLNTIVSKLVTSTTGSGDMKLQGTADNFSTQVFGSGSVKASDLETQSATVDISGSGDVQLWATQNLIASVFGSGNVFFKGNPVAKEIKVSGSGQIKKVD
jgi:hypothetical protein